MTERITNMSPFINKGMAMRSSLLDLLRILAISLIVVGHSGQWLDLWWGWAYKTGFYDVSLGKLGVTIFLLLSGMALRVNDRGQGVLTFYTRRLQRIYPVYWMALTLAFGIGLVFHWDNFPQNWIEGVLVTTGFCAFAGLWGCGLGPGWFIGLIVSLYVCYPWLARLMKRAPRGTLLALLVISVSARLIVEGFLPYWPLEWFPLCRVFEFGLGIYLAQAAPPTSALQWTAPAPIGRILGILSELSFPVFLVHWFFRPVYWHLGPPLHVVVFLILTLTVSYAVLAADFYLQDALFGATRRWCSPFVMKPSVTWNLISRALPSNFQRFHPNGQKEGTG